MKEILTLNKKEQNRVIVLNQVESKRLSVDKASILLKVTPRQIWRLLGGYRREGAAGLAHGNRGRKPVNALPGELKETIVQLAVSKYAGFNHTHLTEKLAECEGLCLSRSCVRSTLLEQGIRSPRKRRPPQHRSRRERYPQEGMLLQTDGSPHSWLEDRGPQLCLIGAIDDATSKVPYALFQEQETTAGYMRMLQEIVLNQGIPLAIYHDRHRIFELNENILPSVEEQLDGKEPKTQFGRLMQELGIESIPANSPQAKGRIERLWGTFQDRLSSELRLAGARTLEDANQVLTRFLPEYNRKFAVKAKDPKIAYRKIGKGFKAEEYFCFKYGRTVGTDNVVRFNGNRLQVLSSSSRLSYARCKVTVQVRLDGSLAIYYQGRSLDFQPAPAEATLLRKLNLIPLSTKASPKTHSCVTLPRKPAPDHPWRGKFREVANNVY
jgi:transposase